jgi:hypothetical protein
MAIFTKQLYNQFFCVHAKRGYYLRQFALRLLDFTTAIRLDPGTQQWIYPSSKQTLQDAGLYQMDTYIASRQNHKLAHIQGNPLFLATQDPQGDVVGGSQCQYWSSQQGIPIL